MSNDRLKYLLEKYAADASTEAETRELFAWIKKLKDDSILKEKIKELWSGNTGNEFVREEPDWYRLYSQITEARIDSVHQIWPRYAAAAVLLVLLATGAYWIFHKQAAPSIAVIKKEQPKNDLEPGKDRAILTLANGDQIFLDEAGQGILSEEDHVKITKTDSGSLAYRSSKNPSGEIAYNTISTPRGGQFKIMLADGSKVWLNAASSLRYPTSFTGPKRTVELTGEGYFEIAHDAMKPFTVLTNGSEVQVLGTHFNINAYTDESAIKTTLLEGSVRVSKGNQATTIRPGEQAAIENRMGNLDPEIKVSTADVEAVTAWKNGRFIFKGDNIQTVMRQLARWYDADIRFEENLTREEFVGVISRSRYDQIFDILEMLEKTGTVSFAVNGRQITVMPFKK